MLGVNGLITRARHQIHRHGLRATVGKTVLLARTRLYLDETDVWYELPLGAERPRIPLPPGLALVRASVSDLPLLEELPTVSEIHAKQRIQAGKELWLVIDGPHPVFACWIFSDAIPLAAARGGQLSLPPRIVYLEDSVVSPTYRGRGMLGPAAWSRIADELERTAAAESVVTKAEEGNKVMRWALARSGFREAATTRSRRVGLWRHVALWPRTGAIAEWLARQFPSSQATSLREGLS